MVLVGGPRDRKAVLLERQLKPDETWMGKVRHWMRGELGRCSGERAGDAYKSYLFLLGQSLSELRVLDREAILRRWSVVEDCRRPTRPCLVEATTTTVGAGGCRPRSPGADQRSSSRDRRGLFNRVRPASDSVLTKEGSPTTNPRPSRSAHPVEGAPGGPTIRGGTGPAARGGGWLTTGASADDVLGTGIWSWNLSLVGSLVSGFRVKL